jgi:histone H3/H4
MINKTKLKKVILEKYSKKIGKEALDELEEEVVCFLEKAIEKSVKNSDFAGRRIIKKEDID